MPLRRGVGAADFRAAVAAIAADHIPFVLPGLQIARLGAFFALCLHERSRAMDALAADCVRRLDGLRGETPPRSESHPLSPRQRELLARWGYPFVFDEFRCHLTLTGPVHDRMAVDRAAEALARYFPTEIRLQPVPVDALALYHQPDRGTPFRLVERIPLRAVK